MNIELLNADCLFATSLLADNSVDAVVTDPPYGLSFMGKKWDYDVPSVELWREVLRVLKPGGHLLSFGGTRTYHRLVCAIEDAGFEIRDQVQWIYGSGFPKSLDVSKAIDKAAGAEREVVGVSENIRPNSERGNGLAHGDYGKVWNETKAASDAAKQWQGWGTALKPANEPICVARKPLEKGLTIVQNVQKWGTGALNIDGTRIEAADQAARAKNWGRTQSTSIEGDRPAYGKFGAIDLSDRAPTGRWPANVLFDEAAAKVLDEQSGVLKSGASRFFYVAKASKRERNAGLEGMPERTSNVGDERPSGSMNQRIHGIENRKSNRSQNFHPTVKPIKLMEYLIKLITPPNGIVLDPFMGSGSTGVAAKNLGFEFIGVEYDDAYFKIAQKRLGE